MHFLLLLLGLTVVATAAVTRVSPALDCNHINQAGALASRAFALLLQNQPQEAEALARQAIQLSPASADGHWVLGRSLVAQKRYTSEALEQLRIAADVHPQARLTLVDLLFRIGRDEEARQELQLFLETLKAQSAK